MDAKYQEVLKQYNFKINNTFRIRGAHIIETNEGAKLFKHLGCSKKRVEFEDKIQKFMISEGYPYIDSYVYNSKEEIITSDSMGNAYVIKDWHYGTEIDLRNEEDVIKGVKNLAFLHTILRNVPIDAEDVSYNLEVNLHKTFEKRTRELKSVRSYIKRKRKKNEFEICFLNCYDHLLQQAILAKKQLKEMRYDTILEDAILHRNVCHGNYTYHNVIILDKKHLKNKRASNNFFNEEIGTTNFEKAIVGTQINDFYHFIRKTMEKNNWDINLANRMIETYKKYCNISEEEKQLLYILILFPEKFWKVSNYYFNGKKTWVPKRTIKKLTDVQKQTEKKDMFLEQTNLCIN